MKYIHVLICVASDWKIAVLKTIYLKWYTNRSFEVCLIGGGVRTFSTKFGPSLSFVKNLVIFYQVDQL